MKAFFLCLLLIPHVLGAQVNQIFPETSEARRQTLDRIFTSPELQVSQGPRFLSQKELNPRVKFEVFYQRDRTTSDGRPVYYFSYIPEENFSFTYGHRGHSVIKMDAATGKLESLKVFFQETKLETSADLGQKTWGSFLLVTPHEPKTSLAVFIEGQRIAIDIPLPFTMKEILSTPVSRWKAATKDYMDWEMVFPPHTSSAKSLEQVVMEIRRLLVNIPEVDDGALDEKGNWVYINTLLPQTSPGGLNCSGFAKWVVDGLYKPITGSWLKITPLKIRGEGTRGTVYTRPYDDPENQTLLRDPFFGLDWTRNLAQSVAQALYPSRPVSDEGQDVRLNSFFTYTKNRGFKIEDLDPILYELAVKNPGHIYLGSVNGDFGTNPVLNQHRHVAVFFPWIDPWGIYRLAVFEVNQETSLVRLQSAYPHHWVHLVEVPASEGFEPHSLLAGRKSNLDPQARILQR